jgi:3-hydroxybutyryl-CoA dehydrogenase
LTTLQTIAVIGAGPLGRRLAWLSSRAGFRTILEDVMPSNLRRAAAGLEDLQSRSLHPETGDGARPGVLPGTLEFATTLEGAVRNADLVIDCVPDELESKLEIFSLLDRMAPPAAIFGTPTVSLSIADLASCTYRPAQCVAFQLKAVFLGEAELPATIEIVQTEKTRPDVIERVCQFWAALGHATTVRTDDWQESSLSVPPRG